MTTEKALPLLDDKNIIWPNLGHTLAGNCLIVMPRMRLGSDDIRRAADALPRSVDEHNLRRLLEHFGFGG